MHDTCVTDIAEWDAYVVGVERAQVARGSGDTVEPPGHDRRRPADAVVPPCEWAVLQAWAEAVITDDTRLARHRAVDRDCPGGPKFRELDRAQVEQGPRRRRRRLQRPTPELDGGHLRAAHPPRGAEEDPAPADPRAARAHRTRSCRSSSPAS